jgi:polyhydroxyalkanoate synthesis regulator phasin
MFDELRGYVQLASGVTEMTTARARELLNGLVSTEVDRAISRFRFAREDDVIALRRQVERLNAEVAALRAQDRPAPAPAPAKKVAAKAKKKRVVTKPKESQ